MPHIDDLDPILRQPVVVRIAGMPAASLATLRFRRTYTALTIAQAVDLELKRVGRDLMGRLYSAIGPQLKVEDSTVGARLVGLKRSIHNGRMPHPGEHNDEVRDVLPTPAHKALNRWLDLRDDREQKMALYRATLAEETPAVIDRILAVSTEPRFLWGVSTSSRDFLRDLTRAQESRSSTSSTITSSTIRRTAKYLCRAAAKTSLFSSFGLVGIADLKSSAAGIALDLREIESVLELDGRIVEQILDWVIVDRRARHRLNLRANESIALSESESTYFHCDRLTGRETVASVRVPEAIRRILESMSVPDGKGYHDVVTELKRRTSANDATLDSLLNQLVDRGLVEVLPPRTADPNDDLLLTLVVWLEATDLPEIAKPLRRLAELISATTSVADWDNHNRRLRSIEHAAEDVRSALDSSAEAPRRQARRIPDGGNIHSRIVHETCVIKELVSIPGAAISSTACRDIERAYNLLRVFDPAALTSAAIADFFLLRYGPTDRVRLVDLYKEVCAERSSHTPEQADVLRDVRVAFDVFAAQDWLQERDPSARWRRSSTRSFRAYWGQVAQLLRSAPVVWGHVYVQQEALDELVAGWPSGVSGYPAATFHVQFTSQTSSELVLNEVNSGQGKNRSRVSQIRARAGMGSDDVGVSSDNCVAFVELSGLFGATTNNRSQTAEYRVEIPGLSAGEQLGRSLPLSDFVAEYDEETKRLVLRSQSLRRRIIPLHNGMMAPFLLPGFAATMIQVFGASSHVRTSAFSSATSIRPVRRQGEIQHLPRVYVGDVLVFRAAWVVPSKCLPRPSQDEDIADFIYRFAKWADESQLPERCFFRYSGAAIGLTSKDRKPQYLDRQSFVTVIDFTRHAPIDCEVVIEEAVPDPAETEDAGAGFVSELLFELSRDGSC